MDKWKLWPYPQKVEICGALDIPKRISIECGEDVLPMFADDIKSILGLDVADGDGCHLLRMRGGICGYKDGGYSLKICPSCTTIESSSPSGLFYGFQTFLQVFSLSRHEGRIPVIEIEDWPAYAHRSFMVDMGRSVFSLDYLKRIVRILGRLKMNALHMHLFDDELCGIRFDGMPFGSENPYAITISEFKDLVRYASERHVEIIPEVNSWGHVGSIVYHRKELNGGEGMYQGASYLINKEAILLVRSMLEQIVDAMPRRSAIHFGMDEGNWYPDVSMPKGYSPKDYLRSIRDVVDDVERHFGKEIAMHVWADHAGRPVPEEIKGKVVLEPWNYWGSNKAALLNTIETYSAEPGQPWLMGAGQSMAQPRGAYHATRTWCQEALKCANVKGVDITLWGWNDLADKFITLFAGAYYAWNPMSDATFAQLQNYEDFDRIVFPVMQNWQAKFRDAYPDDMNRDRGPLVFNGFHIWGSRHGEPVAPTAVLAGTQGGHDYLNE